MAGWEVYSLQVASEFAVAPVNSCRWKFFFQCLPLKQNHERQIAMKKVPVFGPFFCFCTV